MEKVERVERVEQLIQEELEKTEKQENYLTKNIGQKIRYHLERQDVRSVYNICSNLVVLDPHHVAIATGIDKRVLNKYISGYYSTLERTDTERLLKYLCGLFAVEIEALDVYNLEFVSYEEQDRARAIQRQAHRNKINALSKEVTTERKSNVNVKSNLKTARPVKRINPVTKEEITYKSVKDAYEENKDLIEFKLEAFRKRINKHLEGNIIEFRGFIWVYDDREVA